MKLSRRTKISLVPLFLVSTGSYLFWPLEDADKYRISWDQEKISFKQNYLAQLQPNDSLNPPNIIILMADDLGKSEVSIYGNSNVPTPNIDAIGLEGVKFTEAYVTSPICSPSTHHISAAREILLGANRNSL